MTVPVVPVLSMLVSMSWIHWWRNKL